MLMATPEQALPPMTLDHLTGHEGEPLDAKMIEWNAILAEFDIEPINNRPRPACMWPRKRGPSVWAVLLTEPQQELRTGVVLRSFKVPHYIPLVPNTVTRGARRTKTTVYRPMLRGYVLIDLSAIDQFLSIVQPMPVHGFMRFGERLATISDHDVARLRNCEEELAKPKPIQSIWDVGEVVRISDGPFEGLNATITDLANGKRITVELPFMRRAVSTSLDAEQIEKL